MQTYIFKRLILIFPTLLAILTLTFGVIQFVPGGPVEQILTSLRGTSAGGGEAAGSTVVTRYKGNQGMDQEQLDKLKAYYGFDKPWYVRYGLLMKSYLHFDLGESYTRPEKVIDLILSKLPVSITLGLWTFLLTYLISVPLGIIKAVRDGSKMDLVTSFMVLVAYSIPGFVLGVLLLVLFAGGGVVKWFPLGGLTSDNFAELSAFGKIIDYFHHIALPIMASVTGSFAVITLLTKSSFLNEIHKQYTVTARSYGLSEKAILFKHVMRNAMIPLVTGFPAAFVAAFFTGSILIENLFSLDGLGKLSYEAVMQRDYPVVMGSLYLFSLMGLVTNLVADLCYVWVDPRIHFSSN